MGRGMTRFRFFCDATSGISLRIIEHGFLEGFTFDQRGQLPCSTERRRGLALNNWRDFVPMPKRSGPRTLDARVPISVAMWHLHTNVLSRQPQVRNADWSSWLLRIDRKHG